MRRNLFLVILLSLFVSCQKEQADESVLSKEDIVSLQETGANNAEQINFNGTFSGEVAGGNYSVEVDDDTFQLEYKGKEYEGKVFLNGEGNIIELEPKSGDLKYRYLAWSDENHLVVLDENGNYTENEVFLKRK